MVVYAKKINESGGQKMRYAIVQEQTGKGYGFDLGFSLVIEKRNNNFTKTTLLSESGRWDLGEWNTLRFIKVGNEFTQTISKL